MRGYKGPHTFLPRSGSRTVEVSYANSTHFIALDKKERESNSKPREVLIN